MRQCDRIIKAYLIFLLIFTANAAHAFYTVQESGDLLKPEQMQMAAELQFVTSGNDGINLLARFDKGFDNDSNLRFVGGLGTTDFILGGYFKWVPYPDYEEQPAIGFTFGAQLARYEGENELSGRIIPFVSKKLDSDNGEFTPYVSLPFGFSNYNDHGRSPLQLVIGSRYRHQEFDKCDFNAEIGFDLNDAATYISLGAIFPAFE
ncbi:MAG: hypothetical protein A2Z20_04705 [Bdellovibrionales bacterium RBG_16_40_8]|nr:MAG: hypothetical protein A2Z20_04705 [Bdellovibrionales bacterium RBG_16_40_8]